jgi:ribonuclease P protein component
MLPKAARITTKEFKGVKTRLAYRGAFFDISIAPHETAKFACIISKKRIKRAVDRNKARRKVYTALGEVVPRPPNLVFIYPTKHILEAPFSAIKEEVLKAFATL